MKQVLTGAFVSFVAITTFLLFLDMGGAHICR